MYSGGLDSCGALWQLLTQPEYQQNIILVHHIQIKNHENRFLAEKIAVENTLTAIKKHCQKPFFYSETIIDFQCLPFPSHIPFDADCVSFVAGNLAAIDTQIHAVATGKTKTDNLPGPRHERGPRLLRAKSIFNALFVDRKHQKNCQFIHPVGHLTKAAIWKSLPDDVRIHAWSCRRPLYLEKNAENQLNLATCGECVSCNDRKEAMSLSF